MFFDSNNNGYGGDDYFESTRMSFGDHIEELRRHLILAIAGFGVAMVISFPLAYFVLDFITAPVKQKLAEFYAQRMELKKQELKNDPKYQEMLKAHIEMQKMDIASILARTMGDKAPKGEVWVKVPIEIHPKVEDTASYLALQVLGETTLVTLSVQEALMVWVQVALVTGLVIGSPWIFYQIWAFIAAGLYPHEKKLVNVYLPFAVLLFVGGVLFCYFIVIPRAIDALLWFNHWLNFTPQLRLSEWLSFAIWVPVIFGLSFETPLVMLMLERIGIGTVEAYRAFRKIAWFSLAVAAAVFTPTADPYTMMYLWVPMIAFYELGIILCRLSPRRKLLDMDVPESEEMIEV